MKGTPGSRAGGLRRYLLLGVSVVAICSLTTPIAGSAVAQSTEADTEPDLEMEQIIVRGLRRTIVNSLEQKRESAQIIDTLSSDMAGNFPDTNVAEALARIPGVSFVPEQATGIGEFISIRGLATAYNLITIDGVSAGTTSRDDRRVGLSAASADNVDETRVTKTPLPYDDGEGIGGQVNIITRTALDRGRDRLSFRAEGRYSEFAEPHLGWGFQAGFTKLFGENFGIDFSGEIKKRRVRNIQVNAANPSLFGDVPEAAIGDLENTAGVVPQSTLELEDVEYVSDDQERDQLSLSGSIAWDPVDSTRLSIVGRFSERESNSVESFMDFDHDDNFEPGDAPFFDDAELRLQPELEDQVNRHISLLAKGDTDIGRWSFDYFASYAIGREDQEDFELRFREDFRDFPGITTDEVAPFLPTGPNGRFPVPNLNPDQVDIVNAPTFLTLFDSNIDFRDRQEDERWSGGLNVAYDVSESSFVRRIRAGAKFETKNVQRDRFKITDSDDFINPDFSYDPAGDADNFPLGGTGLFDAGNHISLAQIGDPFGANGFGVLGIPQPDGGRFRELRSIFKQSFQDALDAGLADFELEEFRLIKEDTYGAYLQGEFAALDDRLQIIAGVRYERQEGDFLSTLTLTPTAVVTAADGSTAQVSLRSTEIDDTPGVVEPGELNATGRTESHWLPRLIATYRHNDNWVFRAAYTTAIARPNFNQLATISSEAELNVELEPAGLATIDPNATIDDLNALGLTAADVTNFETEFDIGNPDLEDAFAHSFDISVEYYQGNNTAFTVGLFYKRLDNFVFDDAGDPVDGQLGQDPVDIIADLDLAPGAATLFDSLGGLDSLIANGDLDVTQPTNGGTANIYGLEVGIFHQFTWAPGPLANLGFFGNVTYIESDAEVVTATLDDDDFLVANGDAQAGDPFVRKTDFFSQPSIIANAALFYETENFEVNLSYFYQGRQLLELADFGVDSFQQGFGRLDLNAEYQLPDIGPGRFALYFRVQDLTDGGAKPTIHEIFGSDERLNDVITFNGREFRFGIRGRF